ncbi:MAG: hypothetical protein JWQ03_3122 [Variovorax sp.]|nr:hypothetical protein [Variovorax sp.]
MRVFVVTPPAAVVTLEEAKQHLKVEHDEDDALITSMVAAATGHIDGPDGWLGRAIGLQTLEARLGAGYCSGRIVLPYRPIASVVSMKYIDSDGAEQTLAADQYSLRGHELWPAFDVTWPTPRAEPEAVRVQYQAGYSSLPAAIRAAILLMVGDLDRNRTTVAAGANNVAAVPMSTTVENLLSPFRVYG